jgi:hypothetical protein
MARRDSFCWPARVWLLGRCRCRWRWSRTERRSRAAAMEPWNHRTMEPCSEVQKSTNPEIHNLCTWDDLVLFGCSVALHVFMAVTRDSSEYSSPTHLIGAEQMFISTTAPYYELSMSRGVMIRYFSRSNVYCALRKVTNLEDQLISFSAIRGLASFTSNSSCQPEKRIEDWMLISTVLRRRLCLSSTYASRYGALCPLYLTVVPGTAPDDHDFVPSFQNMYNFTRRWVCKPVSSLCTAAPSDMHNTTTMCGLCSSVFPAPRISQTSENI